MELVINNVPVAHTLIYQILEMWYIKQEVIQPFNLIIHQLIFFNLKFK
jgi:hypothetical protein